MNSDLLRAITEDEIETYDQEGVVFLPGMFDQDWIEVLAQGLKQNIADPTSRSRVYDRDEANRTFFYDSQAWTRIEQYREFIFKSPCAEIAGHLMRASRVNFFFDAVFIRSPGAQFATPWHQDEPYWSVDGYDTCSIWMPLCPVAKENALAFVPGSHRWERRLRQRDFGELNPDGQTEIARVNFDDLEAEPFPDIDSDPAAFNVTSWAMQPGDCVAFNGRLIHGGSGRLPADRELRVFNTKWLGDDVRVAFRNHGMDPDHSALMKERGLRPGDKLGSDLYPEVWARPQHTQSGSL